ncbi:MAG: isoleucine--tRNA ligase [Nitrososphaerales archaeon]
MSKVLASEPQNIILPELSSRFAPKSIEESVRKRWEDIGLLKLVKERRRGCKKLGFVEGPPTLNGEPHIGHVRGRIIKDLWFRFMTLKGFDVVFRAGWDTQGLPVELQAEKELGLTGSKSDNLKAVGEEKLVEACKKLIQHYYAKWREADRLLGLSMDYDAAYWTYKDEYIEREWRYLEEACKRGLLGEGFRVVAFCPGCQTSLSHAEVSQSYELVEDPSLYYKVKVRELDAYLVLWTTMPFTVVTDVMVGVKPDAEYCFVLVGGEHWIVGKDRLDELMKELGVKEYQVRGVKKGYELEGLRYIHPLQDLIPAQLELDQNPKAHVVVAEEFVDTTTGSGIVHMSPANGQEDFETAVKRGQPIFNPIDDQAKFTDEAGVFAGMFVRDADAKVCELLREKGALLKLGTIKHQYPLCWRSHHKIVWLARREYFYWIDKLGDLAYEAASKVEYFYEPPRNRFLEIIKEKVPWCISRERVWGTPLPIWVCKDCGHKQGYFSRKAILENAIHLPDGPNFELHRPWIDRVIIRCPKCGGKSEREPFVLDTWHNSGAAPYAALGDEYAELVPVAFLTEGIDQTRGWAYTLLIENVILKGAPEAPYKAFLFQGHVLDEKGNKMSKSLGNIVEAFEALSNYPVDALRFYLMWKASPIDSINFSAEELKRRPYQIISTLYHLHIYYYQNSSYDSYNPASHSLSWFRSRGLLKPTDLWLLSKIQKLKKLVSEAYERGRYHEGLRAIEEFLIDDLSQTYIPMTRTIIWDDRPETVYSRFAVYAVLKEALTTLDILLHPVCPYTTEYLYLKARIGEQESILLESWPEVNEELVNTELEDEYDALRTLVSLANSARMAAKIKRRWPLKKALIFASGVSARAVKRHLNTLLEMVNVKEIELREDSSAAPLIYEVKPRMDLLGRNFREKAFTLASALASKPASEIAEEIKSKGFVEVEVGGVRYRIEKEMVVIDAKPKMGYTYSSKDEVMLFLTVERDKDLMAEGMLRDVARRIQALRKELGYNPTAILNSAKICGLNVEWEEALTPLLDRLAYLVRVKKVEIVKEADVRLRWFESEVDGVPIKIALG